MMLNETFQKQSLNEALQDDEFYVLDPRPQHDKDLLRVAKKYGGIYYNGKYWFYSYKTYNKEDAITVANKYGYVVAQRKDITLL